MGAAIGLAAIIVVLGIFMPDVLHALSIFMLTFLHEATAMLQSMPTSPAMVSQPLTR